jgi:hypothetical protein
MYPLTSTGEANARQRCIRYRRNQIRELTEVGLDLDSLVCVLESFGESEKFGVSGSTIRVTARIFRVPLDRLRVVLDGSSKVSSLRVGVPESAESVTRSENFMRAYLEKLVTIFPLLISLCRVDVS